MTTATLVEDSLPGALRPPETSRGRRKDLPPDSRSLLRLSVVFGGLVGMAAGTLLAAFLSLADLPGGGGSPTVAAVALIAGLGSCLLLGSLMHEARSASLRVAVGGGLKTVPLRRRAELLRRALSGLALRVALLAVLAGVAWLATGSRFGNLWATLPRIDREAVSYLATLGAVAVTMGLGEILFRLSSREGRVDHAPWILVPSILGLAAGVSGLLP